MTAPADKHPWRHSILFIVLIAFLLRLAVITVGHTYRITPRRDHFQFGWEMGRIARSIALGQGFSSPTDLPLRSERVGPADLSIYSGGGLQAVRCLQPAFCLGYFGFQ